MDWLKEVKKAAKEVFDVLGAGYNEGVYEEALAHELRIRKIPYEAVSQLGKELFSSAFERLNLELKPRISLFPLSPFSISQGVQPHTT